METGGPNFEDADNILVYDRVRLENVPTLKLKDSNLEGTPNSTCGLTVVGKRRKLPPVDGKAQVDDILKYIFKPKKVEIEGKEYLQQVSSE